MTAHKRARIIYHMITTKEAFDPSILEGDEAEQRGKKEANFANRLFPWDSNSPPSSRAERSSIGGSSLEGKRSAKIAKVFEGCFKTGSGIRADARYNWRFITSGGPKCPCQSVEYQ